MPTPELHLGDVGAHVRELHDRLYHLGLGITPDGDVFDDATTSLVEGFQRSRGLAVTGIVDTATWQRLVEAGWQLGQRLLYLTTPYLRGDDVADLQVRLSQLGFNPGRIDGVFGPLLHNALSDFQHNCGLTVDGTLTRRTLSELTRVAPTTGERTLINEVVDGLPHTASGSLVLAGTGPLATTLSAHLPATVINRTGDGLQVEELATYANASDAVGVVVISQVDDLEGVHLHYWSSYRSYSRQGERLASVLAADLATSNADVRLQVTGMALPVLRETKMTTLFIEHGVLSETVTATIAEIIGNRLRAFFAL